MKILKLELMINLW